MGMCEVNVRLSSLVAPDRSSEVSLLVDTGATISWIPQEILQSLGAQPFSRLPFSPTAADWKETSRPYLCRLMEERLLSRFQEGEAAVLGATALQGLGLIVDPVAKKLIPRDLLALGHRR